MRLSHWLSALNPPGIGIYPDSILAALSYWGIEYLADTGHLLGGGILVPAPRLTERALIAESAREGWVAQIDKSVAAEFWCTGVGLTDALVQLLLLAREPLTDRDPVARAQANIALLELGGY